MTGIELWKIGKLRPIAQLCIGRIPYDVRILLRRSAIAAVSLVHLCSLHIGMVWRIKIHSRHVFLRRNIGRRFLCNRVLPVCHFHIRNELHRFRNVLMLPGALEDSILFLFAEYDVAGDTIVNQNLRFLDIVQLGVSKHFVHSQVTLLHFEKL